MSVKTKLTEIANDIREILNEQGGLTLDDMAVKLDTVKEQIVSAVQAVNEVVGNVSTLPEMSAEVNVVANLAMVWAMAALDLTVQMNGAQYTGKNETGAIASMELQQAYLTEVNSMKEALADSYTAVGERMGTMPDETQRFMKNLPSAIRTIGDVDGTNRQKVLEWFTLAMQLLNAVNAVDIDGFTEEDAYSDDTVNLAVAHGRAIVQAMSRITAAITEMGGTAPLTQAVDNFPGAIRTIPRGEQWYQMMLTTIADLNRFDASGITGGMNDEATVAAVQAGADQAKTDLAAAYTTITQAGGAAQGAPTIANLPASIQSIPPATGVTVKRAEGTFTTDSSGKATIWSTDIPFKPDIFLIPGMKNGSYDTQLAFVFPEATTGDGYAKQMATWSDDYPHGIEARVQLFWEGYDTPYVSITMYSYYASGSTTTVKETTFPFVAIKYTA